MPTNDQLMVFIDTYGLAVAFVIVGILIVLLLWKLYPGISKFVHTIDIVVSLPAALAKIDGRLEKVEHEVNTNSGTSLKDAVKRIERHFDLEPIEVRKHEARQSLVRLNGE